jgi:hypothetical protein
MLRNLSNSCFALALGTALLLRLSEVREDWIWLAVLCVGLTTILTNFIQVRFMGLGGVGGLSMIYHNLAGISAPAAYLTILTASLLSGGVILAVCADIAHSEHKGYKEQQNP